MAQCLVLLKVMAVQQNKVIDFYYVKARQVSQKNSKPWALN